MKCAVCGYEKYSASMGEKIEKTPMFFIVSSYIKEDVDDGGITYKICSPIYACPKCGTLKIDIGD